MQDAIHSYNVREGALEFQCRQFEEKPSTGTAEISVRAFQD
jgi:hypothetical protein